MTALQMKAELYRNLGIIAQDENMLGKVVKYVSKLAKQMTDDPTCMSKEEFFARVDDAREQIKRGEGVEMLPDESLDEFLERVADV